jgi:hypothetical protein
MPFDRYAIPVQSSGSRFLAWVSRRRFVLLGVLTLAMGIGFAALIAFLASTKTPPSGSQSAVFVGISGLFQVASAFLFSRGQPSTDALELQLRHHRRIAGQLRQATQIAEAAVEDGTAPTTKRSVGELSWRLSGLEDEHDDVAAAWYSLNKMRLEPREDDNDE